MSILANLIACFMPLHPSLYFLLQLSSICCSQIISVVHVHQELLIVVVSSYRDVSVVIM